jgi:hypothetical protein
MHHVIYVGHKVRIRLRIRSFLMESANRLPFSVPEVMNIVRH